MGEVRMNCPECKYFEKLGETGPSSMITVVNEDRTTAPMPGHVYGLCRRYPPTAIDGDSSPWAKVTASDWCGEFIQVPINS